MPIFQDDLGAGRGTPPTKQTISPLSNSPLEGHVITRKASEESIRTELCEGPLLDSPADESVLANEQLESNFRVPIHGTSDRAELIERLKRGESPTWLPNRNVGAKIILVEAFVIAMTLLLTIPSWSHCCKTTAKLLERQLRRLRTLRHYCHRPRFYKDTGLPQLI